MPAQTNNTSRRPITCNSLSCIIIFVLALAISLTSANNLPAADNSDEPIKVFVSILPTEYFVKRIGGKRVQVSTLVQPGHSPATYSPTPKQIAKLASSDIFFRIGVPFENGLMPKLARTIPDLPVTNLQDGIKLKKLHHHESQDDSHHHADDIDPHTWLDPMLALNQAKTIRDTLARHDPAGKTEYYSNFEALSAELKTLDQHLRDVLTPFKDSTIYVFHPAYGYLCHAYDLNQKAITPGGKEPGAKYIAQLIDQAKKEKVRVIFVQPQFSDKAAKTIAQAINGNVVALDPLAYDYIANLKYMSDQISRALPNQVK